MKRFQLIALFSIAAMVFLSFSSCAKGPKKPDGFPDLVPCKLILTQGSAPAEGVTVTLMKKDAPDYSWFINGTSDATGTVELRTQDKFVGAPAGEFVILCQKVEIDESTINDALPKSWSVVPLKMGSTETTPLKITIGTEPLEQKIDLGPKVKENFPATPTTI